MKQNKIIYAYQSLENLANNDRFSCGVLWNLFQLKKRLQPHVDFFNERTDAIKAKYLPFADENGQITGEQMKQYSKEIYDLENMDKEIESEKFTVSIKEVPGLTLKMLESLEDFIDFTNE